MIATTLDVTSLPDGAVMIALTAPPEPAVTPGCLRIAGRPATGGWLFHRGRLAPGRQRCTWIGRPAAATAEVSVALADGSEVSAAPDAAAPPHPADYVGEYPAAEDRLSLLRQFLEGAPSILKLKGAAGFERLRRELLARQLAGAPEPQPAGCFAISGRLRLFLFDAGALPGDVTAVHVLDDAGLARSPFAGVRIGAGPSARQALLVEHGFAADCEIALIGAAGLSRVTVRRAAPPLGRGDLLAAIGRLGAAGFDLARYLLVTLAPYRDADPTTGHLSRELGLMMPAVPAVAHGRDGPVAARLDIAIATAAGALVLGGRIDDPHDLLEHLEWRVPGGPPVRIAKASLRLVAGPPAAVDEAGRERRIERPTHFLAVTPVPAAAAHFPQHGVELVLRSGARLALTSPPVAPAAAARRDRLLGFLKDIDVDDDSLALVAPVVSGLHAEHLRRDRVAEIVEIGRPPRRPEVTVVIPLYKVLSFLRHQAAAFAADRHARDAEFVVVLDSPDQRDELLHVLRGLQALYGITWRVVVHTANLGYAPAVNTGAAQARGRVLVLLNSDVVPADDRWLPAMRARLAAGKAGAVGPKLLYGDDSLQHAGLTFATDDHGRYYNTHFYKGYPRCFAAANRARRVPGLTGACVMLERRVFRAVGGICEDYVVGDFEDSDFSLRLADAGSELWYEPAAELYHYERESITRNASYSETAACRFNQHIHTQRWRNQLQKIVDANLR